MRKLTVVGLGYIGLPTSAMFAKHGWNVVGVDVNERAIEKLNRGEIHIEEVGLPEVVAEVVATGKLRGSLQPEKADCFIVAVPTPHNADNTADLSYVVSATNSIVPYLEKGNVVIIESTIPPRTIDDVVAPILREAGFEPGVDVYLAHCPERVLPGRILIELVENTRIVGGINAISATKAAEVYATFVQGQILETSALSAEMAKLMENTYRDVNIALANELVKISEKLGVDALEVISLANHHPRVNLHQPGPGVGGHCLAVDPYFIIEKAPEEAQIIALARKTNNSMPAFTIKQINKLISSKDAKIAAFGLTYKGNIDDVRESPAMDIVNELLHEGYNVSVFDPHVHQEQVKFTLSNFEDAVKDAELIVVLTDHDEFKVMDEETITKLMKQAQILDTKNCVKVSDDAIKYVNFGTLKGNVNEECLVN
ncbi:nucleotide sugar dehydrogenase [Caryophanon tenue]|uniref:UDP-N-acetyl-D-mannosamine dehydrogenase n=1 Tax=Caryophanon tenue TaxID=33978 RepID=A0A1C0Y8C4_9BACL|nr:nucleotide sugar dehydrogenase [Caryophanon tenue]OCS83424.1 UDP-N-acetyl-D-mannosamine dehydrogenase [Caryophanon tenue]